MFRCGHFNIVYNFGKFRRIAFEIVYGQMIVGRPDFMRYERLRDVVNGNVRPI